LGKLLINKERWQKMKLSHVLVVVVLTAFLSIYGTFLIIKKYYANEESESDRSQLENSQSIFWYSKRKTELNSVFLFLCSIRRMNEKISSFLLLINNRFFLFFDKSVSSKENK